jgi:general secretion pathway protein K
MTMRRNEHGLALVVVLWVVAALSLIAGAMLAASMTSAKIERNSWTQLEVRTAADTAVQRAILSLFDRSNPPALDGREQRSELGDVSVTLSIQDQWGLIGVNYAGPGLLRSLFRANGVEPETADRLVDRIVEWRSPPGTLTGAGDVSDRNARDGYRPRNALFQSLDELTLVAGMTPEIYRQLAPALTVYSHRGDFDMRVAPREVLRVIPGMDQASTAPAPRIVVVARTGDSFAITAKAQKDRIWFSRRAVVQLTRNPAQPYRVLDWR